MATLSDLLNALPELAVHTPELVKKAAGTDIKQALNDSRKIQPGDIFVALVGGHTDGHQYLEQVAALGATAAVVEKSRLSSLKLPENLPILVADNTYKALAQIASKLHGEPGKTLRMVGVTGTNGKTTVTHLIERMIADWGQSVGLIGTLGTKSAKKTDAENNGSYASTGHTTPMAVELQEILSAMRDDGQKFVVMEVSSHALDQYRTEGCDFEVAVITNVTQDHLDFHKTMEHYAHAKSLLFSGLQKTASDKTPTAVINLDDPYAAQFLNACPNGIEVFTYGIDSLDAKIHASQVHYSITGASFKVVTPKGSADVKLQLAGKFSIYNALAALSAGLALGIPLDVCIKSLESIENVRGRFEVVSQNPYVIVDYAHTPDGLQNVLSTARIITPKEGRLIAVFGCGGDRDATKRPKMGRITEELADFLVVTSDNPRTEDPQQIITDVISGIQRFDNKRMIVQADREKAIHAAIDMAGPHDIIVVAGKGHEDYQILKDRTIHFDDREVVQKYIGGKQQKASSV